MTLPGFIPRPSQDNTDEIVKMWRVIRSMQKTSGAATGMVMHQETPSNFNIAPNTETFLTQVAFIGVPSVSYKLTFLPGIVGTGTGSVTWHFYVLFAPLGGNANDPGSIQFYDQHSPVFNVADSPCLMKVISFPIVGPCTLGVSAVSSTGAGTFTVFAGSSLLLEKV